MKLFVSKRCIIFRTKLDNSSYISGATFTKSFTSDISDGINKYTVRNNTLIITK